MCFMYKTFTHDRLYKESWTKRRAILFTILVANYFACYMLEPIENARVYYEIMHTLCNYDRIKVYFIIVFYILFSTAFNLGLGVCNFE